MAGILDLFGGGEDGGDGWLNTGFSNALSNPLFVAGLSMMGTRKGQESEALQNAMKMAMVAHTTGQTARNDKAAMEALGGMLGGGSPAGGIPTGGSSLSISGKPPMGIPGAILPTSPSMKPAIGYGMPDPEGVTGDSIRATNAGKARDLDTMTRMSFAEAPNAAGQQAVANVIMNRARQSGMTPGQVAMSPGQFEPSMTEAGQAKMAALAGPQYQKIKDAIAPIAAGVGPDNTGGADHFFAPEAQAQLGRPEPAWSKGQTPTGNVAGNQFYKLGYGGKPADMPAEGSQVAQFVPPGGQTANDASPAGQIPDHIRRALPAMLKSEKYKATALKIIDHYTDPKLPLDMKLKQLEVETKQRDLSGERPLTDEERRSLKIPSNTPAWKDGKGVHVGTAASPHTIKQKDANGNEVNYLWDPDTSKYKPALDPIPATQDNIVIPPGVDREEFLKQRARNAAASEKELMHKGDVADAIMPDIERAAAAYKRLDKANAIGIISASGPLRTWGSIRGSTIEKDRQEYEAAAKKLELAQAAISMKGQGTITESERRILALVFPRLDAVDGSVGIRTLEDLTAEHKKNKEAADLARRGQRVLPGTPPGGPGSPTGDNITRERGGISATGGLKWSVD